eukprot:4457737-Pyramimonas_sp.AAC.1
MEPEATSTSPGMHEETTSVEMDEEDEEDTQNDDNKLAKPTISNAQSIALQLFRCELKRLVRSASRAIAKWTLRRVCDRSPQRLSIFGVEALWASSHDQTIPNVEPKLRMILTVDRFGAGCYCDWLGPPVK